MYLVAMFTVCGMLKRCLFTGEAVRGKFDHLITYFEQLWSIMHSSWTFPRDNEWIFRGYRALMDLGSNSGLCLRAEAPPDLGRLLESGPALRTVWTVAVAEEPQG